jgi:hypothetical protein
MTAETWMPVSDTFRSYPISIIVWHWEDSTVLWTKGHNHDHDAFMAAAQVAYQADIEDGPFGPDDYYELTPHTILEEWWANRQEAWIKGEGYTFSVDRAAVGKRGAYPVTVIEL